MSISHAGAVGTALIAILPSVVLASNNPAEPPDTVRDPWVWAGFAGGPSRVSVAHPLTTGPLRIDQPRFVFNGDGSRTFGFYGQCSVAVGQHLVVALGYETDFLGQRLPGTGTSQNADGANGDGGQTTHPDGCDTLVAFSRLDGSLAWTAEVPRAVLKSWSSPLIDALHGTVIVATGHSVTAFRLADGSLAWSTPVGGVLVNASPVVTDDLAGRNRLFLTDHSYASDNTGRLICVNTDPFDASVNPYEPGEIVWTLDLEAETSGNSPAYRDGVVYLSTATGGAAWDQGTVRAYPATTETAPSPLWVYEHTTPARFFSGVAVRGGGVYASSFSNHGGQVSAETVRLDAADGSLRWSVPTNRTDTTPVPLGGGLVLVSGGIPFSDELLGIDSLPSLQMILETPSGNAVRLWDTAQATHQDTNQNGRWDRGEPFLSIGGWTIQPAVMRAGDTAYAFVGRAPEAIRGGFFGPSESVAMVDLSRHPTDPRFVVEWGEGSGASPGLTGAEMYTVGELGIHAYGAPRMPLDLVVRLWADGLLPDFNADGLVNFQDLQLATQYALQN